MKLITPIAALLIAASAWGAPQDHSEPSTVQVDGSYVSITAKGDDVRSVLYDLFRQSGHNFVLDSGVRFVLYLHLEKVSFEQALDIVTTNSSVGYEVKNGVYYIGNNRKTVKPKPGQESKPPVENKPNPTPTNNGEHKEAPPIATPGKMVTDADLQKHLTTRYSVTPIRKVFEEFTRQTGIKIEVAEDVPNYKLDAFLIDTSLKYALDVICDAAKLKWKKAANGTIFVEKE